MESQQLMKNCDELEQLNKLKSSIKQTPDYEKFIELFEDHFLMIFLRTKNYNVKKAFIKFENYMKVRIEKYPEFFRLLRPSTTTALECKFFRILKNPDQLNQTVAINRIRFWNPSKVPAEDCLKTFVLFAEQAMMCPEYSDKVNNGFVYIMDAANYNIQQIKGIAPLVIKTFGICFSIPVQYKAIHIVNETYIFSAFLKAMSPLMPAKLRQRLHLHGSNLSSLHKHVSPFILPESLGGMLPEEDAFYTEFEEKILDRESYYERFAQKLASKSF